MHYDNTAKINYTFLFSLYTIAERKYNNIKDTIKFNTFKELQEKIKLSTEHIFSISTISRIVKDTELYFPYFSILKPYQETNSYYVITLKNNFKKGFAESNTFITLTQNEIDFLIKQDTNLLTKYYLYLKYWIGHTKEKQTDTTAKQFLSAIGYSQSGNNITKISNYNKLLSSIGLLQIQTTTDNRGYFRNIYRIP